MDTALAVLMIVFLVLLGPVVLVIAAIWCVKKGWYHDFRSLLATLLVYRSTGAGTDLYSGWIVPDVHGQDAAGDFLDDGE